MNPKKEIWILGIQSRKETKDRNYEFRFRLKKSEFRTLSELSHLVHMHIMQADDFREIDSINTFVKEKVALFYESKAIKIVFLFDSWLRDECDNLPAIFDQVLLCDIPIRDKLHGREGSFVYRLEVVDDKEVSVNDISIIDAKDLLKDISQN